MAIYHLRLKLVSRGATRSSVVAAAAYRSGQALYDDSAGRWWCYQKPDILHTEILTPAGSAEWVGDRQRLWNFVERSEKRRDAQLAREVEFTLPRELSTQDQIILARQFVRDTFVAQGMVADIALHRPDAADGGDQPHIHALLTLRELDPTSPTGFAPTKNRDWNEREDIARAVAEARKRYNNTGLEVDKNQLDAVEALRNVNVWRAAWAEYANRALADAGSAARIDHRTLEAQGIFRAPQPNLGLTRHVEAVYAHLKDRITQWVAVKKRISLNNELEHYKRRDPVKLAEFVLRLGEMAESFTAQFRKHAPIPEVGHER